jgi:hypothetical protein
LWALPDKEPIEPRMCIEAGRSQYSDRVGPHHCICPPRSSLYARTGPSLIIRYLLLTGFSYSFRTFRRKKPNHFSEYSNLGLDSLTFHVPLPPKYPCTKMGDRDSGIARDKQWVSLLSSSFLPPASSPVLCTLEPTKLL